MYKQIFFLGIVIGVLIPNCALAEKAIEQRARASATAIGSGNRAVSRVNQSASQTQSGNPNFYRRGQRQTIVQKGTANATAIGNNNLAVSQIEQHSHQTLQGHGDRANQSATQNATSNATAIGDRNTVKQKIRQYNRQNRWSY